jgi:hypothetical protein
MWEDAVPWGRLVASALCAREFFQAGQQYIVREGRILLIDQNTGRVQPISRWVAGRARVGARVPTSGPGPWPLASRQLLRGVRGGYRRAAT